MFGCLCYASIIPRSKDKFLDRATPCVFICYPHGQKGYKVYDLSTHKVFTSRNLTFYEHIFPFHNKNFPSPENFHSSTTPTPLPVSDHEIASLDSPPPLTANLIPENNDIDPSPPTTNNPENIGPNFPSLMNNAPPLTTHLPSFNVTTTFSSNQKTTFSLSRLPC